MNRVELRTMDIDEFLEVAEACGLDVDREMLQNLERRSLLEPTDESEGAMYTGLHLYVLARYLESITQWKHPWKTERTELTTAEFRGLSDAVHRQVVSCSGEEGRSGSLDGDVIGEMENFLESINPFGALSDVATMLRSEAVSTVRNQGRLYLEVSAAMERLATMRSVGDEAESKPEPEPPTRQMYDLEPEPEGLQEQEGDGAEEGDATRDAIDEVVSATDQSNEEKPGNGDDVEIDPDDGEEHGQLGARPMQVIQVHLDPEEQGLEEESSDPIVLVDDEEGETHVAESVEEADGDAESSASTPSAPPPSPAERRAEFDKQCRELEAQQQWEHLAELYEGRGMDVTSKPEERQKIFVELGRLYEVKLRDKERAFEAFDRAWREGASTSHRQQALEGIERIGKSSGFFERYLQWLRRQLEEPLDAAERARLSKDLARALFADQQYEDAFEAFASFLVEAPQRHINDDTLGQLDRLGEHVNDGRVQQCYATLRQRDIDESTRDVIDEFAATTSY